MKSKSETISAYSVEKRYTNCICFKMQLNTHLIVGKKVI